MQAKIWHESIHGDAAAIVDPEEYGYTRSSVTGILMPLLVDGPLKPAEIPDLCNCKNCSKKTCICRQNNVACCKSCKCSRSECKNPCGLQL